jgi:hypothetical protein
LWCTISIRNSCSIWKTSFPASKEIEFNFAFANAESSMNCTLRGITIDWSDEDENADDSIRFNLEFDSNEIDESDLHCEKHDEQRLSTLRGMTIDWSDENENADDSILFNPEFDSNDIDESVRQSENVMNRKFQYFVESQLIQVRKMKM